ncbi:dihydrodipicolinate synthase family protein [Longispora albida]|uniref:dihydrodipicolinate synthase family protein n=1 Tax=Longispora albida TaxID=203523 RepID=UPI000475AFD2|nr:dihydrodipicolinate synthase family protein [Longispora albida]
MTLTGLFVPLITPFDTDGSLAADALAKLAGDALTAGAAGLVALGTTGEPGSLSPAEQETVITVAAAACHAHGAKLIIGANTPEAFRAIDPEWTDAALTLVPPFLRPGEDGVVAHFTALAAASPVPLVVYHIPYRTGQALSAGALRRIAAIPGVAAVKYAVGGIDADTVDLLADPPAGFSVLAGDDVFLSPMLALGAHGGVLASAHIETAHFAAQIAEPDRERGARLARLSAALFAAPNPTVIKGVLHAQGRIPAPDVRLPLVPAPQAAVDAALALLGQ